MTDHNPRKSHLDKDELNQAAKDALPKIVEELPTCNWEDKDGDGLFLIVKREDMPKFSEPISRICESCKVNRPYGSVILRYKKAKTIPSDRFSVVIPLEVHAGDVPKIKDKDSVTGKDVESDLAVGWATYITKDVSTTAGATILRVRVPGEKGTNE